MRRVLEVITLVLIAVLAARTWWLQGLAVPLTVSGGSMANTLLGPHRELVCDDCGFCFPCGDDRRSVAVAAVCPNCGYADNKLQSADDRSGDRVLVDRSAFQFRPPRRWEVIAFRHPDRASEACVKRIIGLPGESIDIRLGDIYIDGAMLRKSLPLQRTMAVLVHDSAHRPRMCPPPPPRWQSDGGESWHASDAGFAHPGSSAPEGIDWLTYRHWQRAPGEESRVAETPITDQYGYNQLGPRRVEDIHPVVDLMLSLRVAETTGQGSLWVRASRGSGQHRVCIEPRELRYAVFRNSEKDPLETGALPRGADLDVEVSLFDGQFLLAFDGRVACAWACEAAGDPPEATSRPFSVGSEGLAVQIGRLRVLRDVYYTHPLGDAGRWAASCPVRLAADEYFVLGDNSPISQDGRGWSAGPGISHKLLIGKALVVHFPARSIRLGPWHFQVPDPAKIRYIR